MRLLLITGPPAVGKMTVGREVCARSDFRLFHNHHTIEPLLEVFGWGTPAFDVLNEEFRRRVIEEAARHEVDLVFTFAWAMDQPGDVDAVERYASPYVEGGGEVWFVELYADLDTRLARNRGESRLLHKASKRDVGWSEGNVRELEERWVMNSSPDRPLPADRLLTAHPHLRLDNTHLTPGQAADAILAWLPSS